MQFTSKPKSGNRNNFKLRNNIDPRNKRNCYIQRRIYVNKKNKFGKKTDKFIIDDKDLNFIFNYLKNKKKK